MNPAGLHISTTMWYKVDYLWGIKLLKENAIQITGKVDYWRIPSSVHEAAINLNPINNNDINLN